MLSIIAIRFTVIGSALIRTMCISVCGSAAGNSGVHIPYGIRARIISGLIGDIKGIIALTGMSVNNIVKIRL